MGITGVVTVILLIPLICIMLYRTACDGGMIKGKNGFFNCVFENTKDEKLRATEVWKVGGAALLFRLLVYLIAYMLMLFVYNNDGTFLEWFTKWDATNYIGIASGGYDYSTIDGVRNMGDGVMNMLVFLPFYPLLGAGLNIFVGNIKIALLATSTICFVAGCMVFYMAVHCRYGKAIAEKAVVFNAISPFAFYQGAMLPESTFFLMSAVCIYFVFKKKWLIASLMGILLAFTRLQGVIIIAFIGMEWIRETRIFETIKKKDWKSFRNAIIHVPAMFAPFLGIVMYLAVNVYYTNDAFYFVKLQYNVWGHKYVHIPEAMDIMMRLFLQEENGSKYTVWLPELLIFFGVICLLYYAIGKHSIGTSIYLLIYLVISYSADYVISGTRYMAGALILFVVLAEICERKQWLYKAIIPTSLMLQVIFMACHLSGWHLVT